MSTNKQSNNRGFTIVELLIVIVVIGILAAITIVAFNGISARARVASMKSDLENSVKLLELAKVNAGTDLYPADINAAGLKATTGSTYAYQPNNTAVPASYCLTITNAGVSYFVTNLNTVPSPGGCSGILSNGTSCPSNYIVVPGNSSFGTSEFCVMKYEAKNYAGVATSQAASTPWVSITQAAAASQSSSACSGCHLITEAEWMTIAANVLSVSSNWSSGTVGSGYIYSGHNDNSPSNPLPASVDSDGYSGTGNSSSSGANQRRTLTLTNGEVIWDFAGNVWEWTSATIASNQQPGISGEGSFTLHEWNDGALGMHGLPAVSKPVTISAQAATWSSAQGIGQLFSRYDDTTTRGYIRGGSYEDGTLAGVLSLDLFDTPSASVYSIGFRVAK